jgi:hypothetical protein
MQRSLLLAWLVPTSLALSGCVAGMAASAVGMAAHSAHGTPRGNAELAPLARQECSAQAARHGTVHIIDVEQSSAARIVVWGTVTAGSIRQSFECRFGTAVTSFKLRPIAAAR